MGKISAFDAALLSEFSYIRFNESGVINSGNILQGQQLTKFLADPLEGKGVSSELAERLAADWRIVSHRPDTASGFSATVFERMNNGTPTGEFTLAIRGTDPGTIDLPVDIGDLVLDGLAWSQIVDLFNYWQEITTPAGDILWQATLTEISLADVLTMQENGQTNYINDFTLAGPVFRRIDVVAAGPSTRVWLPQAEPTIVDVVGHSLGGHLATAFSRLFPDNTRSVVGINGAGHSAAGDMRSGGNIDRLYAVLGGATEFDSSKMQSLYGEHGLEVISQNSAWRLWQPAGDANHHPVFTEDSGLLVSAGHSSAQMTDSLAVHDLLIAPDPDGSVAQGYAQSYGAIARASSQTQAGVFGAFERSLVAIASLFGTAARPALADRASYFQAYNEVSASVAFRAFATQEGGTQHVRINAGLTGNG